MNSNETMQMIKRMKHINNKFTSEFVKEEITDEMRLKMECPMNAYRNNKFLVSEYLEADGIIRLSICRAMINKEGQWEDKITFDELFEIKNYFYKDFDAVEIYPAQEDYVNVANMRHLWIFKNRIPFAWRKKKNIIKTPNIIHLGKD